MSGCFDEGEIVAIESDWREAFALWPHKTIGGKRIWLKRCYSRRVWINYDFVPEPETQYATIFEVLQL